MRCNVATEQCTSFRCLYPTMTFHEISLLFFSLSLSLHLFSLLPILRSFELSRVNSFVILYVNYVASTKSIHSNTIPPFFNVVFFFFSSLILFSIFTLCLRLFVVSSYSIVCVQCTLCIVLKWSIYHSVHLSLSGKWKHLCNIQNGQ